MSNALLRLTFVAGPFADPTADETYFIARMPQGGGKHTVRAASAVITGGITSDATNWMSLRLSKIGVDGLASPVNISSLLGGASSAWVADTPREFAITETSDANTLLSGEYVKLTYDENGTVAPGSITVFLEASPGV